VTLLKIDGSFGEGGGQILRSCLSLSLATGTPFRIEKIRAGRDRPGLLRQHLTAVRAAAEIGGAEVEGASLGSQTLVFRPAEKGEFTAEDAENTEKDKEKKGLPLPSSAPSAFSAMNCCRPGEYEFRVGTAGSAVLVLQTILPPLLVASGPSTIMVEGGTHNPAAPPFEFLERVYLPLVERMGPRLKARLERPGFFPAGGGRIGLNVKPAARLRPIELLDRGEIVRCSARAMVSRLPESIAERELGVVERLLGWERRWLQSVVVESSPGPGNVLLLEIESEHVTELFTGFGMRGVPAEKVARRAVREAERYLASEAPVGPHLADQLILPLGIAGGGRFRTLEPTDHLVTNIEVVRQFLPVRVETHEIAEEVWEVDVRSESSVPAGKKVVRE
jgi:RNA 3'-terminal phosphate cyclase (ATP)